MPKFVSRGRVAQPKVQEEVNPILESPQSLIPKIKLDLAALPSKGVVYPTNAVIQYRGFSFGEVKTLSQEHNPQKPDSAKIYKSVLEGIYVENMSKDDLTLADLLYIGFLRKISTLGNTEKATIKTECPYCRHLNEIEFKLSDVNFDELQVPKFPIKIDLQNKKEYHFSPLTVGQYYKLLKSSDYLDSIAFLAMQCTNHDFKITYEEFFNCSAEDGALLQKVDAMLYHGMQDISEDCTNCKREYRSSLDGGEGVILPFRGSEDALESRIRFG